MLDGWGSPDMPFWKPKKVRAAPFQRQLSQLVGDQWIKWQRDYPKVERAVVDWYDTMNSETSEKMGRGRDANDIRQEFGGTAAISQTSPEAGIFANEQYQRQRLSDHELRMRLMHRKEQNARQSNILKMSSAKAGMGIEALQGTAQAQAKIEEAKANKSNEVRSALTDTVFGLGGGGSKKFHSYGQDKGWFPNDKDDK